jgi:hypothetical protein
LKASVQRSGSLLLFGAVGAGAYFFLAPRFPKDQSVNVVLGDVAPDVTDLALHYAPENDPESARDVSLHFDRGHAPRVVHHEARLVDGDYVVAIEVRGDDGKSWSDERRVAFRSGGSTSIDVSERARAALRAARGSSL